MGGKKTDEKKKATTGLAKTIQNKKKSDKKNSSKEHTNRIHTIELQSSNAKAKSKKLKSITQMSDFEEMFFNAQLENKRFVVEKQNSVVLQANSFTLKLEPTIEELEMQRKNWNRVKIPRRPHWNFDMKPEELHQKERESFDEWRKNLAILGENPMLCLSPFEKNIEVWKQLWRVVEKCQIVIQVVDARTPLLFRCPDLEAYVQELNLKKVNILFVNKADLLTFKQRIAWANYFEKSGIKHLFFSADFEQMRREQKLKNEKENQFHSNFRQKLSSEESDNKESDEIEEENQFHSNFRQKLSSEESDNEESDEIEEEEFDILSSEESENNNTLQENNNTLQENNNTLQDNNNNTLQENNKNESQENNKNESNDPRYKIWTSAEVIDYLMSFQHLAGKTREGEKDKLYVGMVGYPNVGKSSSVNVLYGEKCVGVAPQPGKTKHFQTIFLNEDIVLCDCPGLIFPTLLHTKADMIINGLLSVDNIRGSYAHREPVALVTRRIPRTVLETVYGIILPKNEKKPNAPPSPEELLTSYAFIRGFRTVHGIPDESRAARIILKDYIKGYLCYVEPPPETVSVAEFNKDNIHRRIQQKQQNSFKKKLPNSQKKTPTYIESSDNLKVSAFAKQKSKHKKISRKLLNAQRKNNSPFALTNQSQQLSRTKFGHSPLTIDQLKKIKEEKEKQNKNE